MFEPSLDLYFSALGHPIRRLVLARLARGPASVTELAAAHSIALPSFLAHLKKLETAGLNSSLITGRTRTCALTPTAFTPAQDWLDQQRQI